VFFKVKQRDEKCSMFSSATDAGSDFLATFAKGPNDAPAATLPLQLWCGVAKYHPMSRKVTTQSEPDACSSQAEISENPLGPECQFARSQRLMFVD